MTPDYLIPPLVPPGPYFPTLFLKGSHHIEEEQRRQEA